MMNTKYRHLTTLSHAAAAITLSTSLFSTTAFADTQVRLQSSNQAGSFSEGYAMSVEDWNLHTFAARNGSLDGFHFESSSRPQVWISDIGTLLFDDADGDGYHSGFSLTIDVDSEFGDTEVYAKIYLEPEGEAAIFLHKTSQFTVYGTTIGDEYRVDSELRNNYAAKTYNVAIDIHEAWTDKLLDTATARGFDNLNQLPLESADLNQPSHNGFDNFDIDTNGEADVVVTEYAGAFNPTLLMLLIGGMLLRRRRS